MSEKSFKVRWGFPVKIITFITLVLIFFAVFTTLNNFSQDNFRINLIVLFIILPVCVSVLCRAYFQVLSNIFTRKAFVFTSFYEFSLHTFIQVQKSFCKDSSKK